MRGRHGVAALLLVAGSLFAPVVASAPTQAAGERAAPKPVITKVKPASGPASGGTKVTVKGQHLSGATKVLFGKAKGTKVTVKSDKKLTVLAPAHTAGSVKLKVKTPGGSAKATYTYIAPPGITSLTPSSGLAAGGTKVTVTGSGFATGATVTFGGVAGSAVHVVSSTSITVTAPAHAAGGAPVVVTSGQASSPKVFTYLAMPTLTAAPLPGSDQTLESRSTDVACFGSGTGCMAVGGYGTAGASLPFVDQLSGGTWTASSITLPANAHASPTASLKLVDCLSTTFCAAAGTYRSTAAQDQPMVTTWNGAVWTPAVAVTLPGDANTDGIQMIDIDCVTVTDCRVVGYYFTASSIRPVFLSFNGATWSSTSPDLPAGAASAGLISVDCSAAGECVAAGRDNLAGGGSRPYLVRLSGGTFTAIVPDLPLDAVTSSSRVGYFNQVRCPVTGTCYAAGNYLSTAGDHVAVARLVSGTWTVSTVPLPGDAANPANTYVGGMACPDATHCVTAANYLTGPMVTSERGLLGTVTPLTQAQALTHLPAEADASAPNESVYGIACAGVGSCVNVGDFAVPGTGSPRAMISRMSGGTWLASEALPLAGAMQWSRLVTVAADSATTAVAVGTTFSGTGFQALLASGIPIGP